MLIYFIIINIISFTAVFLDKKKAQKHKWRIKENHLHTFSLLGGAVGTVISMTTFNHKTKKVKFCIITAILLFINIIIYIKLFLPKLAIFLH